MARIEVTLPAMGEGIIEATITKWFIGIGDSVEEEEPLAEIATDKVDSEIPSPASGILEEILFQEEEIPSVGDVIAVINTGETGKDEQSAERTIPSPERETPDLKSKPSFQKLAPGTGTTSQPENEPVQSENYGTAGGNDENFLSPLIKNLASELNIPASELASIKGTGSSGRITKKDMLRYIDLKTKGEIPPAGNTAPSTSRGETPDYGYQLTREQIYGGEPGEVNEMDRTRKLIAGHMIFSKNTAPHVTSFVEIDVTNLVQWREKIKARVIAEKGVRITFMPAFIEASIKAMKDFPMVNISLDGTKIVQKKAINIGIATAQSSGNLIVPVLHHADKLNLLGIAEKSNDLITRARENKLKPTEITGGTFTITNVGSFGNITGTPVINQPQVAILAVGAIVKKPAVVSTPDGDTIGIRHMLVLSLSYDHRIVDGALGGMYLKKVGDYLSNWDLHRDPLT
jgi:2-oxoglutarate dehydrogenase E2 component (dihydrolipoamide succinyltransferase)